MEKYYLKTFGCKLNRADSDSYRKVLERFFVSSFEKEADLILINSCGVIDKTERKIIKCIREYKKEGKFVILTGCLPYITDKNLKKGVDEIIPIRDFKKLEETLERLAGEKGKKKPIFPKKISALIPLSQGCLGSCSYCGTKLARGKLESRNQEEVIEEIKTLLSGGCGEIQLTSQDLAVYGMERGKQELPELLSEIIKIEGKFKIRLGMTNPYYTEKILSSLLSLYESEKIYKYLHLPVQSGSEKILKSMKRRHGVGEFYKIADAFYSKFEDFLLATDVIVGFPGETEEDFKKTCKLIKEVKPHIVNITRFSPRKGTQAAKLKDMPEKIKKERSRDLCKITREMRLKENKKFIGKKYEVFISEEKKTGTKIARLPSYRALIVNEGKSGEFRKAFVTGCEHNYLKGKLL